MFSDAGEAPKCELFWLLLGWLLADLRCAGIASCCLELMTCGWLAVICMAKPMRPLPVLLLGALVPALRRLLATAVCAGMDEVVWLPELALGSVWVGEVAAWKPCCVARGREEKEAGWAPSKALPAGREAGCFGGRSAVAEMLSPEGVAEVPARLCAWPSG